MRSCSSSVLVQETAKQITSVHSTPPILGYAPETGGRIRRLQPKRSVRAVLVVVLNVDSEHLVRVSPPDDQ
jgi:hypothetical protein